MPLSANFSRVTVDNDPTSGGKALFVEGFSEPPTEPREIFVAVTHGGELLSQPVDDPALNPWQAVFPEGETPFEAGGEVFVVGVATREAPRDPFVWQGSFEIKPGPNA